MPFKKLLAGSSLSIGFLALALLLFAGCSGNKGASGKSFAMGQAASVGPLTYTVLESEWKESLDGAMGQRLPKNRFLVVNLSITNKSAAEVGVPLLTMISLNGAESQEENKGEGVTSWMGYLRRVGPAETLSGRILFDVPPGGYKLRISSGGEADAETTALVEIPYRADPPPVKSVDPMAMPATK